MSLTHRELAAWARETLASEYTGYTWVGKNINARMLAEAVNQLLSLKMIEPTSDSERCLNSLSNFVLPNEKDADTIFQKVSYWRVVAKRYQKALNEALTLLRAARTSLNEPDPSPYG